MYWNVELGEDVAQPFARPGLLSLSSVSKDALS